MASIGVQPMASMQALLYLTVLVESFLLGLIFTTVAKRLAFSINILDHPNPRKVHARPMPLLGGLGIFLAFMVTVLGNLALVFWLDRYGDPEGHFLEQLLALGSRYVPGIMRRKGELFGLLTGGVLIFGIGLYDDKYYIRPLYKLFGQIIAALIFFGFFYFSGSEKTFLFIENPVLIAVAMVFWIVGVTNSINLMDNMDGLCAGVSAISLFFLSLVMYQVGEQTFLILALLALLGGCLGFLWHNFNPARIFMGDAGSMFIGYMTSCLIVFCTFYNAAHSTTILSVAMPPIILAVPIFDTATVVAIRLKRGLPIYQADKNHFSHRLVALGMNHKAAVLFIYLVTICTGTGALLLHQVNFFGGLMILIQVAIILGIILLLERAGKPSSSETPGK
jgi:UDP-GlcNAc:undecaprenyl-phosphate/decaprenyl-phosphate GlcNAc-1-phosphate transferase